MASPTSRPSRSKHNHHMGRRRLIRIVRADLRDKCLGCRAGCSRRVQVLLCKIIFFPFRETTKRNSIICPSGTFSPFNIGIRARPNALMRFTASGITTVAIFALMKQLGRSSGQLATRTACMRYSTGLREHGSLPRYRGERRFEQPSAQRRAGGTRASQIEAYREE